MAYVRMPGGGLLKVGNVDRPSALPIRSRFGVGAVRKIALIGTASTVYQAPWDDPTWEIWAHASACNLIPEQRVTRWIDLHPPSEWQSPKKWHADYQGWLRHLTAPIWMQKHYKEVPMSVKFPRERIVTEFGPYFTSQTAWMIAAALTEGVSHLGLWGIHYAETQEYRAQRPGCEWILGVAFGRGVNLCLPPACPLLRTPWWQYGYDSHSPEAKAERRAEHAKPEDRVITPMPAQNNDHLAPFLKALKERGITNHPWKQHELLTAK